MLLRRRRLAARYRSGLRTPEGFTQSVLVLNGTNLPTTPNIVPSSLERGPR